MSWDVWQATVTQGSKVVTKVGGQPWTNPLVGVSPSRAFIVNNVWYEIEYVIGDNELRLREPFVGAGGLIDYRIPTSPNVPIETFALEQAAFQQWMLQIVAAWQAITTGNGTVILTDPITGQQVSVRSQAEWDRLLDLKVGKGEFGWGGSAPSITTPSLQEFLVTNKAVSGVYSADPSTVSGLPPGYGPCICVWEAGQLGAFGNLTVIDVTNADNRIARNTLSAELWQGWDYFWSSKNLNPMTTDTIQAINTLKVFIRNYATFMIQSAAPGAASWIEGQDNDGSTRWILGFPSDNVNTLTLRNYKGGVLELDARRVNFPGSKGFIRNAQALEYATGADFGEFLKSEQSAGSAPVNGVWRAFISVRHRGGNGNLEPSADSTQWGWALVDNNMTQGNFNEFVLEKTINGVFLGAVHLKHSGNTTVDANGFLKTASPVVKLFADGSSELNAESEGVTTERLSEGLYRISGCLGLNSDGAWGGIDGGIDVPKCRNSLPRVWVDYDVEEDGSILLYVLHREHNDAPRFARNHLNLSKKPWNLERDGAAKWQDQTPIDIPADSFVSLRVQMPHTPEDPSDAPTL